jgi:hypothetical protein
MGQGNADAEFGGIRWVGANTSEWNFGGGRDDEGGRNRDPNIIDVAVSPGQGHAPGRTQEELLDYTTAEAERRFAADKNACVLEASFAIDTAPPAVSPFASDEDPLIASWVTDEEYAAVRWPALDGAPAVMWTKITDVTGIDVARFHWHPDGQRALHDSIDMVNLTGDIWAADIPREDLISNTVVVPSVFEGEMRPIEAWVFARDSSDSANQISTPLMAFEVIEPWGSYQTVSAPDTFPGGEDRMMVFQDGTVLAVESSDFAQGEGDTVDVTVTPIATSLVDVENIRDDMEFVGVARDITAGYSSGASLSILGYPSLTLHYPQYEVGGLSEDDFGLFRWVPESERWIFRGGAGNPAGDSVTGEIAGGGRYGVFHWEGLDVGSERGLSGVIVEPNPFSPNGDGLYDDMIVTFFLGREADYVNIEFYDLEGRLARRLVFQEATDYTGRTPASVSWDGTDRHGNVVPYGIYVMRVEAKFKTEPTFERVNRPVVIIK